MERPFSYPPFWITWIASYLLKISKRALANKIWYHLPTFGRCHYCWPKITTESFLFGSKLQKRVIAMNACKSNLILPCDL